MKQINVIVGIRFLGLLVITFCFVPLLVEDMLFNQLLDWGISKFFAGHMIGICTAVVLLASGYFLIIRMEKNGWTQIGFKRLSIKQIPFLLFITFLCIVFSIVSYELSVYLGAPAENNKSEAIQESEGWFSFLLIIFSGVLVSPIYEEIFYRGIIFRFLRAHFPLYISYGLNGILFSLAHWPNWNILLLSIFNGILLAICYERTKSVFASVFVHGLINFIILILTLYAMD